MSCGNHCYEIGGPWISEDPNCPVHGHEAQRRDREREEQETAKDTRIGELEEEVRILKADFKRLRRDVARKLNMDLDD